MIKTTVGLSPELIAALDELASRSNCSRTEIVRRAISRYVAGHTPEPALSVGIFDDSEVMSENIDAWLQANWRPE